MEYVLTFWKNGRKKKVTEGFHNIKDARKEAYKWVKLESADEIEISSKRTTNYGIVPITECTINRYSTTGMTVWILCHIYNARLTHMTHYHLNRDGSLGNRLKW